MPFQVYRLQHLKAFDGSRRSLCTSTSLKNATEWANAKPFKEVPGPKKWPILGTAWQLLPVVGIGVSPTNQLAIHDYQAKKYGKIGREIYPGFPPIVWTVDPDDVETVFRNEGRFPVTMGLETLKKYRKERADHYSAAGLMLAQGEEWWKIRSRAQQSMMKPKNIYNYLPAINEIGDEFIDRIRLIRQENNEMKPNFLNEMYRWALESVAAVAMNTRLGCLSANLAPDSEAQKMIDAVNTTFTEVANMELGLPLWRFMKTPELKRLHQAQDFITETSTKYVNKTLEKIKNGSGEAEDRTILEELLVQGMSPKDAMVMVIDMLIAGIDTTSHTTSFLFYYLAKNPDKQEILRKEVLSVVGPRGAPVTVEALNELRYLKACVKESLRLMPVTSGNARVLDSDAVLSGYQIPKGTFVVIPQQWMCLQEEHYPKARDYIPERWIKGHEMESKAHKFVMLPFGFGPRMCIGRRLAEMEMWQLTAKIMQNFRIEYHFEDIGCKFRILNAPDKPLRLTLTDL